MGPLRRHALLKGNNTTFSFHRLPEAEGNQWLERVIGLLDATFPFEQNDPGTWGPSAAFLPHVQAAWAEGRSFLPEGLGHLLNNAGAYLSMRAEYPQGRRLLEISLKTREATLPPGHPDILGSLWNLGFAHARTRQHAEAREYLTRARALRAEHPEYP
uniref:Tetratricopeptide repeat-containing protein n=1 Tax=Candidatus Kentrum sp. SD TaxID=2126332 RepID=A0A450Y5L0_9GAMM|nr:MAG: Tetratricopeptide repeat-containing protein [Candidatus Kentron sp. SD]VFK44900.1 MAG: Tetratricopeptide repeat-containing protein [Candidatus Kentron sp. SD]VFK78037.1 MAG: Tetratricopeptide repeat-containing protein [Candidatus Kentron sp. SD]